MKKTDVYVVVDTPKKAKKLKKVLEMFGEKHFSDCHDFDFEDCVGEVVHFWEGAYFTYCSESNIISKCKVSIKELRNILAKEHLRPGDVVALGYGKSVEYIGVFKSFNNGYFEVNRYLSLDSGSGILMNDSGYIKNFIRYATEEEKALLEPNKELEVGKWYKGNVDIESLVFITEIENVKYYNRIYGYGFIGGKWHYSGHLFSNTDHEKSLVEATTQEVEESLIEEAKRRGFVNGCIGNNSNIHDTTLEDCELFFNNEYEFDNKDNSLRLILDAYTTWTVFKEGQWASIIEKDNFTDSDIAIVERLHDALLDMHGYSLESKLLTDARILANKIKSNIK